MITLYYLNKNHDIQTIELPSFDTCIPLKESGIFIAYRDGTNFIKNPPETFPFTNLERLIIGTEFFDTNYLKDSDFRNQNTQFCPKLAPVPPSPVLVPFDITYNPDYHLSEALVGQNGLRYPCYSNKTGTISINYNVEWMPENPQLVQMNVVAGQYFDFYPDGYAVNTNLITLLETGETDNVIFNPVVQEPTPLLQILGTAIRWDEGFYMNVTDINVEYNQQILLRENKNWLQFNYKRPTDSGFITKLLDFTGFAPNPPNPIVMQEITNQALNTFDISIFPVGTEYYFSDAQNEYGQSNHNFIV